MNTGVTRLAASPRSCLESIGMTVITVAFGILFLVDVSVVAFGTLPRPDRTRSSSPLMLPSKVIEKFPSSRNDWEPRSQSRLKSIGGENNDDYDVALVANDGAVNNIPE
eukprot:CAMPEP_0172402706 /NCGR_PEP_ID=MMETSP1061-20121228/55678_1 /TAXON_ID=37318 /ORGANISM="Pseudo-nitzschia pungens, Strain cf. pungens" /LENGTH=108 /DNA_ID=CAMNT_0013136799 /DNA_START=49 /DNA_END=372 /DNA_ORIENTATION=-